MKKIEGHDEIDLGGLVILYMTRSSIRTRLDNIPCALQCHVGQSSAETCFSTKAPKGVAALAH